MAAKDLKDDRAFNINFSGDGVARLRQRVKDKLKEFMGDYTDDTLVEYVIVLLRNGRQKEEAKKELNVFLGDDSESFVSWLWNHLSSNLDLYVQSRSEVTRRKLTSDSQLDCLSSLSDSDHDERKSVRESKSRRNREWKGLITDISDPPPLLSSEVENVHSGKSHRRSRSDRVNRPHSPSSSLHRKRRLQNERQPMKRDVNVHSAIGASRRLLQCAVRDAVGTSLSSTARPEPVVKRLHSVVSTSTDAFVDERPKKIRSVANVPHAVAAAIKAAAEAAEDVAKVRCTGNVFDRLGRAAFLPDAPMLENDSKNLDRNHAPVESEYLQKNDDSEDFEGNMEMMEHETGVILDSTSDDDGFKDVSTVGHRVADASQTATSGNGGENSLTVKYSVAENMSDIVRRARLKDQDTPSPAVPNASRKIVNISVNVNTWKPPHYKLAREVAQSDNWVTMQEGESGPGKPGNRLMEDDIAMGANNNGMVDAQKGVQGNANSTPASYPKVPPSEDAASRTIFICNVHFAATKDTLSRHFNKFGEVLKVIIVTDAATGQPKGSAYIEFMRKEAAEHALSLNGTSFMSRILKVVKGSIPHEVVPMLPWRRIPRVSPFSARLARLPFPRSVSSAFRGRPHIKPGPRSLQWKREAGEGVDNLQNRSVCLTPNTLSLTPRKLTYVRPEMKQH